MVLSLLYTTSITTPLFFNYTPRHKSGENSSIMFSAPVLVSILVPIVAGYMKIHFQFFTWFIVVFLFIVSLWSIKYQENFFVKMNWLTALDKIKKVRFIFFLEGLWEALIFAFIPLYTLFFINNPLVCVLFSPSRGNRRLFYWKAVG